ncbi:phosphoribosylanthranilate isomerase [Alkalihalobacillus sp. AL-G]|uniref:phosphoribosylanthranilate isomerase n=1 Tax=Alkalihalobacillus sp. AL-G TaxID=2926399 RepID=UPI00272D02BF|nr:phosphoribosylanthranilate isomerase [Alkalihalobacillus sp. AL-G]WLD91822.1 phosphoribosylanthranilate isomerase [Alkalihalobacillus sp. AL-G]
MTALKICGIQTIQEYERIAKHEIDYAGFVLAPSKRRVTPEHVRTIIDKSKVKSSMKQVAVLVDLSLEEIVHTCELVKFDVIQLHGDEDTDLIEQIRNKMNIEIWKAIPHSEKSLTMMDKYMDAVDGFVIDTKVPGKRGGTGLSFDWSTIPAYSKLANLEQKRCFIAGGITPENVTECLTFQPYGIDLSSGVEKGNRKDDTLLNLLIERMKNFDYNHSK